MTKLSDVVTEQERSFAVCLQDLILSHVAAKTVRAVAI